MDRYFVEKSRRLPVTGDYDVVVVGGGTAGVAAAVAAARIGVRVCLLEKAFALGGLATLGNVVVYLPLCDGMGNQVIRGLGEELLKLSICDGYRGIPECWRPGGDAQQRLRERFQVQFNPASFMLGMEDLLRRSGADLLYDTRLCDVLKRKDQIRAVVVENKSGRSALTCRAVVDATGDADVCARAGEPTLSLKTNVAGGWFYYEDGLGFRLEKFTEPFDRYGRLVSPRGRGYAGDDARDVTQQVLDTRMLIQERFGQIQKKFPDRQVFLSMLPTIPTFRMTRRLRGEVELQESDERRTFPDSVGMIGDWRKRGPVYYIPFRSLAAPRTGNLVTAGRCISADTAWDITRVIAPCAVTGEAAGTAAALLCTNAWSRFSQLPIEVLQGQLRDQGALVNKKVPISKVD